MFHFLCDERTFHDQFHGTKHVLAFEIIFLLKRNQESFPVVFAVAPHHRDVDFPQRHLFGLDDRIDQVVLTVIFNGNVGLQTFVDIGVRPGSNRQEVSKVRIVVLGQL